MANHMLSQKIRQFSQSKGVPSQPMTMMERFKSSVIKNQSSALTTDIGSTVRITTG